jgi:hypothetical protein
MAGSAPTVTSSRIQDSTSFSYHPYTSVSRNSGTDNSSDLPTPPAYTLPSPLSYSSPPSHSSPPVYNPDPYSASPSATKPPFHHGPSPEDEASLEKMIAEWIEKLEEEEDVEDGSTR